MKNQLLLLLAIMLVQPFYLISSDNIMDDKGNESSLLFENYLTPSEDDYSLSLINLQVDVMGLFFFGPQVALDFQFADMIAVGPYMRWHYAGLIYQGVVTDWFSDETTTSLASYSIGAQAKVFIPIGTGQHRPYFGLGFEKSFGSDSYDPGGTLGDRIYEYESNVFHIDLGYRLLTNSSFNMSVGIAIAFGSDTKNIGYNENNKSDITYYEKETRVMPLVQLVLGWQLGK